MSVSQTDEVCWDVGLVGFGSVRVCMLELELSTVLLSMCDGV